MASSDFIYEYEVKNCPVDEATAEKILRWLGVGISNAKKYIGVSTCRAVLVYMAQDINHSLYPPEYQTTGFDRQ